MKKKANNNAKSHPSIEAIIKQTIVLLKEIPGSTLNSIAEYIKGKWNNIGKEAVLEAMKKMRRKEQLIQIKCYFRVPNKVIKMQLRNDKASFNSNKRERRSGRTNSGKAKRSKSDSRKNHKSRTNKKNNKAFLPLARVVKQRKGINKNRRRT